MKIIGWIPHLMFGLDIANPTIIWSFSSDDSGRSRVGPSPMKTSSSSVNSSGCWIRAHGGKCTAHTHNNSKGVKRKDDGAHLIRM